MPQQLDEYVVVCSVVQKSYSVSKIRIDQFTLEAENSSKIHGLFIGWWNIIHGAYFLHVYCVWPQEQD